MGINIAQKTAAGTTVVPIETQALANRNIWVEGEIDPAKASDFVKQMIELNRESTLDPIRVLINSYGGSVIHGLAMYDAIRTSKAPVETFCIGTAYSMAAVLFAAGTRRFMLEHAKLMLHEPLVQSGAGGSASSVKSMSKSLEKTREQINRILCFHTGRTAREMNKATGYDHYFTAEESIEFGLADEIAGIERIL